MTRRAGPDAESELRDMRRAALNLLEDLEDERRRLARADEEWRSAFDSVRDAIFIHDEQCRITRANRTYLALARCSLEQAIGRQYWEVFPPGAHPILECAAGEAGCEREITVGGRIFRSRAYVSMEHGGVIAAIHILEDVTDRHRAEQELRERSRELAEANEALRRSVVELRTAELGLVRSERLAVIGTLVSGLAHELNNPLMGVMNYLSYARERSLDPQVLDALGKAERELGRMEAFVRNLLLFGRYTSEEPVATDVEAAVDRSLDLLGAEFRKRGIRVEKRLPPLPQVAAVPSRLQQVFINLFMNAADAMVGAREKRLTVSGQAEDQRVSVVVADTGMGVAPEHEGRLFEPFFTTKAEGEGTGLGLSVSRKIMAGFGGALDYLPDARPGASFRLTLRPCGERGQL